MDLEPAIIGILAAVFTAGAAAAIAAVRSARSDSRDREHSPLNGASPDPENTGRFAAAQRVEATANAISIAMIEERVAKLHEIALAERGAERLRGEILNSLANSVELAAIALDHQSRKLDEILREIKSRH